jgi:hypothetical protein
MRCAAEPMASGAAEFYFIFLFDNFNDLLYAREKKRKRERERQGNIEL